MRSLRLCLVTGVLLAALASGALHAGVYRKVTGRYMGGEPYEYTYYDDAGEVLARHTVDESGRINRTSGTVPDGLVREYYPPNPLVVKFVRFTEKVRDFIERWVADADTDGDAVWGPVKRTVRSFLPEGQDDPAGEPSGSRGTLKAEWRFSDGRLDGMSTEYDRRGVWIRKYKYKKGKLAYSYLNDER